MQLAYTRIWTRVDVSISHDDNLYTAGTSISPHVKAAKTEFMRFNHKGDISTLNGGSLKLGFFLYLMAYQLFLGYLMPKPFS